MAATSNIRVIVQQPPFDCAVELAKISKAAPNAGAVANFLGIVRGEANGKPLQSMSLEHYPGMTQTELEHIAVAATARFDLQAVTIIHRVGTLIPGDQIVLVATASAHRHAAFDGCAFVMDYLKTSAPFWKKEVASDGTGTWVDARVSDDAAKNRWQP